MKKLLLVFALFAFVGGVIYGMIANLSPKVEEGPSYVGKCFSEKNDNVFIASIKIKIDRQVGPNKYNVLIYYTKKPETVDEIYMLSQVQTFNNSWASSEQLELFYEVPCD